MKLEGDKVFHHPAMVYPQSFSHEDVAEVVELKSGKDVMKGKHELSSETNAIGMDECWSEPGSTCSVHGEDYAVKNQTDNVPSSETNVEIRVENVKDRDVAKVIVCCKDSTCFEVKDICIDEGVPSNVHMSIKKEKEEISLSAEADLVNKIISPSSEASEHLEVETREDPVTLSGQEDLVEANIREDVVSKAMNMGSANHTAHGSDMKGLGEEYLISFSAPTKSQGTGFIFGPFDCSDNENDAMSHQDNATTLAALLDISGDTNVSTETTEGRSIAPTLDAPVISSSAKDETSKDRNLSDAINQDKPKADAVSSTQPESLKDQHDSGESSFSYAGPVSGSVTYSGPIAFSGSLSLRSDSSTTSTRSFAFPIMQNEWNSSPVRMAKGDRRRLRKHRGWRYGILCCRF